MPLSSSLPWDKANPLWAAALNPLLANPVNSSSIITNLSLKSGATTFGHGLGRVLKGWIIVDVNAPATIYRSQPLNDKTLTLTSSAACVVSIEVF